MSIEVQIVGGSAQNIWAISRQAEYAIAFSTKNAAYRSGVMIVVYGVAPPSIFIDKQIGQARFTDCATTDLVIPHFKELARSNTVFIFEVLFEAFLGSA
jgi:hypothetical protein